MPHLTGTGADIHSVLSQVNDFIVANSSWVQTYSGVEGTGLSRIISKGGNVISLRSGEQDAAINKDTSDLPNGIAIFGGTGYSAGGTDWLDKVTGGPKGNPNSGYTYISDWSWAGAYFGGAPLVASINWEVFINGDEIWVSLHIGEYYQHLAFGEMEMYGGGWNGGFYFGGSLSGSFLNLKPTGTGTYNGGMLGTWEANIGSTTAPSNFFVRTDLPAAGAWTGLTGYTAYSAAVPNQSQEFKGHFNHYLIRSYMEKTPNINTLDAVLAPMIWEYFDAVTESKFLAIGAMQSTFHVNMYALNAEALVTVGAKTYKILPIIKRTSPSVGAQYREEVSYTSYAEPYADTVGGHIHGLWGYAIEVTA